MLINSSQHTSSLLIKKWVKLTVKTVGYFVKCQEKLRVSALIFSSG